MTREIVTRIVSRSMKVKTIALIHLLSKLIPNQKLKQLNELQNQDVKKGSYTPTKENQPEPGGKRIQFGTSLKRKLAVMDVQNTNAKLVERGSSVGKLGD